VSAGAGRALVRHGADARAALGTVLGSPAEDFRNRLAAGGNRIRTIGTA